MNDSSTYNGLIPAIAALLIFVVGYLALLLSVLAGLLTAALLSKGISLCWSYVTKSAAPAHLVPAEIEVDLRPAPRHILWMSHSAASVRKSGL